MQKYDKNSHRIHHRRSVLTFGWCKFTMDVRLTSHKDAQYKPYRVIHSVTCKSRRCYKESASPHQAISNENRARTSFVLGAMTCRSQERRNRGVRDERAARRVYLSCPLAAESPHITSFH